MSEDSPIVDIFASPFLKHPFGSASVTALVVGAVLALTVIVAVQCFCTRLYRRGICGIRPLSRMKLRCCIAVDGDDVEAGRNLLAPAMARSDAAASSDARDPFKPNPRTTVPVSENWSLKGRVAIVTGGSKGLGRAIVEELLAQGCEVLTCARDISPLAELTAREPRCVAVAADVSTSAGRAILLTELRRKFSFNLDILVNNVGTNLRKPSEKYSDAEYDDLCATNQGSAFHLSRACYDALRFRKGCIVNGARTHQWPKPKLLHTPPTSHAL